MIQSHGGVTQHFAPPGLGRPGSGQDALFAQPGQFAQAIGNTMNGVGQGTAGIGQGMGQVGAGMAQAAGMHSGALGNLGNAVANNYGSFSTGNAGIANALANERSAAYGAMSQGEAARQLAAGNIANQALAAYGGMGNAAMNAWGVNQASYNQALQNMFTGNQMAVSQLGQSRNQALSGLGDSTTQLGRGLAAAGVLGNADFGMGGGSGFSATSPSGSVASGSYGGGGMSGAATSGVGPEFGGITDRSFGGLDSLRGDINAPTFLDNLESARQDGFDRLDAQHYSSRSMPFDALRDSAGALQSLAAPGYSALRQGMDQLYGNVNANRADFSPFQRDLRYGFDQSSQDLREVGDRMSRDFGTGMNQAGGALSSLAGLGNTLQSTASSTQAGISDLFRNSLGNMAVFQSPLQRAQAKREAALFNERARLEDRMRSVQASMDKRPGDSYLTGRSSRLQSQIGRLA